MSKFKKSVGKARSKIIPVESLVSLRIKLIQLPARSSHRQVLVNDMAQIYNVSVSTMRRKLKTLDAPKKHRSDRGRPRKLEISQLHYYCELIAAIKVRTTNKKGRHISTQGALEILEYGIENPDGPVEIAAGLLKLSTVNYYLKKWGLNQATLQRESPAARYQAEYSNDLWHFDLSSSELKHLENPPEWVEEGAKNPLLMLYGVSDDSSGVCYDEYHCVYGEDTEAALRFLFNAMSKKSTDNFPFSGIPKVIHMDNGPISKSRLFLRVMAHLGIKIITHLPRDADERKTAARSKSKVERPFRTVKEAHETLFHFNKPETEVEANRWMMNYLVKYNQKDHREYPYSRMESWLINQPPEGIREMCDWEQFTKFAREPEQRFVGIDTRINVEGVIYEVDPDLAGEEVTLWWGLFDDQLFVELNDERYGPYQPVGPLASMPSYRRFKKTKYEIQSNRITEIAKELKLSRSFMENSDWKLIELTEIEQPAPIHFSNPNVFHEFSYTNVVLAKRAIAEYLGKPITLLSQEDKAFIEAMLSETLVKKDILEQIDCYFQSFSLMSKLDLPIGEQENYVN